MFLNSGTGHPGKNIFQTQAKVICYTLLHTIKNRRYSQVKNLQECIVIYSHPYLFQLKPKICYMKVVFVAICGRVEYEGPKYFLACSCFVGPRVNTVLTRSRGDTIHVLLVNVLYRGSSVSSQIFAQNKTRW